MRVDDRDVARAVSIKPCTSAEWLQRGARIKPHCKGLCQRMQGNCLKSESLERAPASCLIGGVAICSSGAGFRATAGNGEEVAKML